MNDKPRATKKPRPSRRRGATRDDDSSGGVWEQLTGQFDAIIGELDPSAAARRVGRLRRTRPPERREELVERLIRDKCIKAGTVGAATSGAGLIPGIGAIAALTVGVVADIRTTFRLQAELVLEIAAAHRQRVTESEKRAVILLLNGLGAGANEMLSMASRQTVYRVVQEYAERWAVHALPLIGVGASAAMNMLSTYLIGKRADAYFRLGPEAAGDWHTIWGAIHRVDERAIGAWFSENARSSWRALHGGVTSIADEVAAFAQQQARVIADAISDVGQTIAGVKTSRRRTSRPRIRSKTTKTSGE